MSGVLNKIKNTLSDHPNASSDPNVNPNSGAKPGHNEYDPALSDVQNNIRSGQGHSHPDEQKYRAGSLTSEDATSTATGHAATGPSNLSSVERA